MKSDDSPVALVTGSSAGLGFVIARVLLASGYRVVITGRDAERLEAAAKVLVTGDRDRLLVGVCDVTVPQDVTRLFTSVKQTWQRLDVLVNCVGTSDRGLIENLESNRLEDLWRQNVISALLCSQAALDMLESSAGTIVNIGSLAGKVGARYIGGYATVKHALAGMTQQMRLELKSRGIHVALVSPGPIARSDAGKRYREQIDATLPPQASAPGGGAKIKGLPPERVAQAVLDCIRRRKVDVVMPRYLRLLIAVGHAFPRLGDWLLLKFTSAK
jgi:NAD(P)-dependent dehydrogenase (short-subunit alcohol dehydrogenase family)